MGASGDRPTSRGRSGVLEVWRAGGRPRPSTGGLQLANGPPLRPLVKYRSDDRLALLVEVSDEFAPSEPFEFDQVSAGVPSVGDLEVVHDDPHRVTHDTVVGVVGDQGLEGKGSFW